MAVGGLHQIAIRADDIDAAIAFYRDFLGLPLLARFDPPGIAFFDLGGPRLMLAKDAPAGQIYLRVGDLAATRAALIQRGAAFESEPVMVHRDDSGQFGPAGMQEWMTFLRDPAGNIVGLAERV